MTALRAFLNRMALRQFAKTDASDLGDGKPGLILGPMLQEGFTAFPSRGQIVGQRVDGNCWAVYFTSDIGTKNCSHGSHSFEDALRRMHAVHQAEKKLLRYPDNPAATGLFWSVEQPAEPEANGLYVVAARFGIALDSAPAGRSHGLKV